ncbi:hypothetical protein D3C71_1992450 [compost metagenome]
MSIHAWASPFNHCTLASVVSSSPSTSDSCGGGLRLGRVTLWENCGSRRLALSSPSVRFQILETVLFTPSSALLARSCRNSVLAG